MASPSKKQFAADVKKLQEVLGTVKAPLPRMFGEKFALVLENEANIRALPLNAMVTVILAVATLFMSGKQTSFIRFFIYICFSMQQVSTAMPAMHATTTIST